MTIRDLQNTCTEASARTGRHFEVIREPISGRYAVTVDLPDDLRAHPEQWLRARDCNTIHYWIRHLNAVMAKVGS